jgi:hypothetical protein
VCRGVETWLFCFFSFCFLSELIPYGRLHVTNTNTHTHTVREKYTFLGFRERSFHHFGLWKLPVWIVWRQYILLS